MGITPQTPEILAKRITLANCISVLTIVFTTGYGFYYAVAGQALVSEILFAVALLHAGGMVLNLFGIFWVARLGIITILACSIFACASMFGRESGLALFFLPQACICLMLSQRDELPQLIYSIALPITFFTILEVTNYHVFPPYELSASTLRLMYTFSFYLSSLIIMIIMFIMYLVTEASEVRLREANTKLAASEQQARAITSAIPDWIFRVRKDGTFIDFHSPLELSGGLLIPVSAALGRKMQDILPNEIGVRLHEELLKALTSRTTRTHEIEVNLNDMSRSREIRLSPLTGEEALFIIRDITAEKVAQRTVIDQQAKMAAASKLSSIGEMAAGIAHEINNPLAAIVLHAGDLKEFGPASKGGPEIVRTTALQIEATALRIANIIKSLRAFSGDLEQEQVKPSSVTHIIEDVLNLCRERFRHHEIDILVVYKPESLTVPCRPLQVSQVLINLLNNAFDAVEHAPMKWVKISAQESDDMIDIDVTDSGPGVPEGIREKIMQPFFTTKDIGKGTGLGLSISRGIVEAHKGRLWLDAASVNTRFVISLPRHLQA